MTPSAVKFGRFFLVTFDSEQNALDFLASDKHGIQEIKNVSTYLKKLSCKYLLRIADDVDFECSKSALRRLISAFENKQAGIVYSDFVQREGGKLIKHPLIDYQQGSIRDDFNFGHLLFFSREAVQNALQKYGLLPSDDNLAFYDLRLKISMDHDLFHVPRFLYTVSAKRQNQVKTSGKKTEAHFGYAAKDNLLRQKKLEKIAINHLKRIGAYLPPCKEKTSKDQNALQWKASVVIPVLNRKKTIADALNSALEQKTDFPFNMIVVDNHSSDGTTDILKKYAAKHPHIHHIIPERRDLGIGGCWNEAIYSPHCGRYVVQLDSDDLYSSCRTLQKIVDTLRQGRYALVVGSYTIVNERLKKIPPGLIDHREWTQANGHNNLLRVNGMGAPRAFDLSVLRRIGFPNVSYGEDYAVTLRITREYPVGRIYENLYWCRRWKDNTDAGISLERQNQYNHYKDGLRSAEMKGRQVLNRKRQELAGRTFAEYPGKTKKSLIVLCRNLLDSQKKNWPQLRTACRDLLSTQTRRLSNECEIYLQYNPARAISGGAAVDSESIKSRPCFLCQDNLPREQQGILYRDQYLILCNPAPIFEKHFTIAALKHEPQEIASSIASLLYLAADASPKYAVFYNGPACGASAPDHLHFQMGPVDALPFLKELKGLVLFHETASVRYLTRFYCNRPVFVLESKNVNALTEQFAHFMNCAREILKTNQEPLVNVICFYSGRRWHLIIFMRQKHRPAAYFAEGGNRIFISPGAVDMAGVVITPLLDNYKVLDYNTIDKIYREVSLPAEMMDSMKEIIREDR